MSKLSALLSSTTCKDILDDVKTPMAPVCLDANLSVQEGCQALAKFKIQSAPVFDAAEGGFIGMLDFRDLVTYILEVFHKVPKEKHSFDSDVEVKDIVKRALQNNTGVPVKLVSNLSKQNPLIALKTDSKLSDAINEFSTRGIHRVVIIETSLDGSNKFVGVLSQSSIVAFIAKHLGRLATPAPAPGDWQNGDKTVSELGLVKGGVISITHNDSILDALYTMHTHHITSVAIVDRSNGYEQLCGSISMSDMKEILSNRGGYRRLYDNAFKFFTALRNTQGLDSNGNDKMPNFVIHPTTPLVTAIEKMAATRGHRAWVVEGVDKLVGVISLSDFVKFFV